MATERECTTDDEVVVPWTGVAAPAPPPVPHLVIAWMRDWPERAGEAAPVLEPCWLGRPHDEHLDDLPIVFLQQRPGHSQPTPVFDTTAISRRQLRLTPLGPGSVQVENAGKRALLHNGVRVSECAAVPGDTLHVEDVAIFVVDSRPPLLPSPAHPAPANFRFGTADAHGMVGESPAAWALRAELAAAAAADAHVLLWGPTGAGKESAARAVHSLFTRSEGPLVARNAATIPPGLIDAELFGHARDYPSHGMADRAGLVGAADRGHLLLDEIGELPQADQTHLLRVLDAGGQYQRLGENHARRSDFRLIGATNRDPGALKLDLLARFDFRIVVTGLDARRSDIPLLLRDRLACLAREPSGLVARFLPNGDPSHPLIEPRLIDALVRHDYTEHTRELHRLIGLSLTTSPGEYLALTEPVERALEEAAANYAGRSDGPAPGSAARLETLRPSSTGAAGPNVTAAELSRALWATQGHVVEAASLLGLSRHAVRRLMERYGMGKRGPFPSHRPSLGPPKGGTVPG